MYVERLLSYKIDRAAAAENAEKAAVNGDELGELKAKIIAERDAAVQDAIKVEEDALKKLMRRVRIEQA